MGANNEWVNSAFNTYGPAEMYIYDDGLSTSRGTTAAPDGVWVHMCRFRDINFMPDYAFAEQSHRWEGLDVTTGRELTGARGRLSCAFAENINPAAMQLIYGDKETTQTISSAAVKYTEEMLQMFINQENGLAEERHLGYAVGSASPTKIPAPTIASGGAPSGSSGSGWSSATYYFWVFGLYLRAGASIPLYSAAFGSTKLDIDFTLSAPSDQSASSSGYNGLGIAFTGATQSGSITVTDASPNTDLPMPDYYLCLVNTSDDLATAKVLKTNGFTARDVSGTTTINLVDNDGLGSTYVAPKGATFWYNAGTHAAPSWTQLTIGTDVEYDYDRGVVKLKTGSGATYLKNGFWIQARYFWVKPKTVKNLVGPTGLSTDPRKVKIVDLRSEAKGASPRHPEGQIFTLFKVDFAGVAAGESFGADQFYPGANVTMECLTDPSNSGAFGQKEIISRKFRSYTQQSV